MKDVGQRIRMVRNALGEQQPAFAATLRRAAAKLGIDASYDNTTVSKLENGSRRATLDDIAVIASVDPQSRGREWLAWNVDARAKVIDPARDRKLSEAEEQRALRAAETAAAARKKPGPSKRRRASGE